MKFIPTLLLLFTISFASFAQTKTAIPGTKYTIEMPKGFQVSTGFSGIQDNASGSSILVSEIPAPVNKMNEGFTKEALLSKGMTLTADAPVDYQNAKARFLELSQSSNGILYLKQILIFGNDQQTVLVTGTYPEAAKSIAPDIRTAILSVSRNEAQNDNPFDAVNFTIDPSNTGFKLAKYLQGTLIYTQDGQIPSQKSMLVAGNSISKINIPDARAFSIDRLKSLPEGESIVIKEISETTLDNLPGWAILADNIEDNSRIYQVILFSKNQEYYILIGIDKEASDTNLVTFKNIFKTFKQK